MKLVDGIRRHGFRRWYSRELNQAHLCLLLLLLCAIGLLAALELLGREAPLVEHLGNALLLLICLGVGLWALRRYFFLMLRVEGIARQAVCPQCRTYGSLQLSDGEADGETVGVRCRKCARAWRICDLGAD